MSSQEILTAFWGIVVEDLNEWILQAHTLLKRIEDNVSVATFSRITTYHLRNINTSIENLKSRIHDLYQVYKDLEKEHQIKPLSLNYFIEFADKMKDLTNIIDEIKYVSGRYSEIIAIAEKQKININDYIRSIKNI